VGSWVDGPLPSSQLECSERPAGMRGTAETAHGSWCIGVSKLHMPQPAPAQGSAPPGMGSCPCAWTTPLSRDGVRGQHCVAVRAPISWSERWLQCPTRLGGSRHELVLMLAGAPPCRPSHRHPRQLSSPESGPAAIMDIPITAPTMEWVVDTGSCRGIDGQRAR